MPTSSEELRRRIVADINAGDPGAKLGSERELAERYNTSRSSRVRCGGAGGSGSGSSGDRPVGRHLHPHGQAGPARHLVCRLSLPTRAMSREPG